VKRPSTKHQRDFLDQAGALELEARIKDHWRARGYAIGTQIEAMATKWRSRPVFVIRSNLVNGLPPRKAKALKREAA
jgi:hypothetical protein